MENFTESNMFREDVEITLQRDNTPLLFISDEVCIIFRWFIFGAAGFMVNGFGIVTNIINIICFLKQGFKDSVNVNFLGLAVSDLGALTTMMVANICYLPAFDDITAPVDLVEILYLPIGWPHIIFVRVTAWITAIITLERCLYITMPLQVKTFLTTKRSTCVIVCLYVIFIGSASPVYYANSYGWKFSPQRNRTILGLMFTSDREQIELIAYALNHVTLPFLAFITVIISTCILVSSLRTKSKWRETLTQAKQGHSTTSRDQKIGKMIVVIAAIFIVSYLPLSVAFIAMMCVPSLSVGGYNQNAVMVCGGISVFLEEINSAVNFLVYYQMSTKYRETIRELFHRFQKSDDRTKSST